MTSYLRNSEWGQGPKGTFFAFFLTVIQTKQLSAKHKNRFHLALSIYDSKYTWTMRKLRLAPMDIATIVYVTTGTSS